MASAASRFDPGARSPSILGLAIPSPVLSSPPPNGTQPGDPVLTEALTLLRQARREGEEGRPDQAMALLQQVRTLLGSDGVTLTPEARRRRYQMLEEVEAFSEELAEIRAMSAIPSEEGAPLVSPEDLEALEMVTPKGPAPAKPEMTLDVPIEFTHRVEAVIELLTTTKREQTAEALARSGRYLPLMRQIFAEKGLPEDLVNLAYIESAFKLYAYSRARAVGIWQFIKGTARKYGLKVDWWVDERRDPVKATAAAATYLSDLYAMFQSWPLAIAAYNAGEGKVLRAMTRQRTDDFWKLNLPRETKLYFPAFVAMTIIAKNPEAYGFARPVEEPWQIDQVTLSRPTDLRLLAKGAGVSVEELREWNPELNRPATPPQEDYLLNLPPGREVTLLDTLSRLTETRRLAWRQHQVRPGETLSTIAHRYGTTAAVLMEMNGLENPHRIRAGTQISVPVPSHTLAEAPAARPTADGRASSEYSLYVVKPGDSLWEIARAHRVSPHDLGRWNNLEGSLIHPGRTLRIYPD